MMTSENIIFFFSMESFIFEEHVLYWVGFCSVILNVVSVSCFGVRFSVMFHFMFVHYTFSSVWVSEWSPFGK